MNNLEKEFKHLMEDHKWKICEIEQKYERKILYANCRKNGG